MESEVTNPHFLHRFNSHYNKNNSGTTDKSKYMSNERNSTRFSEGDFDIRYLWNKSLQERYRSHRHLGEAAVSFPTQPTTMTQRQHKIDRSYSDESLKGDGGLHCVRPDLTRSLSYGVVDGCGGESGSYRIRGDGRHVCFDQSTENDEMMAAEKEDMAINLSAEVKPATRDSPPSRAGSPVTANNIDDKEQTTQGLTSSQVNSKYSTSQTSSGASKRKPRNSHLVNGSPDPMSPLVNGNQSILTMAAQNGLSPQQVQQMLLAQQGLVPPQLQQMMQAQQTVLLQQQQQKAQEQALVQLNEQLQLNVLQQTHLAGEKKLNGKQSQAQLQQLMLQHHQLLQQIQQLQLPQRQQQFLLACLMQPYQAHQGMISPEQMHQIWKEAAGAAGEEGHKGSQNGLGALVNGTSLTGASPLLQGSLLGLNGLNAEGFPFAGPMLGQLPMSVKQEEGFNPLFRHGLCKWPGCDAECTDISSFTKHLNSEHNLDDKNTAQARVQMQIVSQLEIQLSREKELLHAMMQHLHLRPHTDSREERESERERKMAIKNQISPKMVSVKVEPHTMSSVSSQKIPKPPPVTLPHLAPKLPPLIIPPPQPPSMTSVTSHSAHTSSSQPATPTGLGPMRRRVSDKCNLPISAEIQRNREFYKNTDVRPPFTYASLIRQAIIESENKQLTLNEVYQWFQNTFAYFRRNEATWKNAVRHNLSLHKCFMRVENVKGAVWTVDEVEFYKRRPQKLTGALSSPSYSADSSPYSLDASIRAAIEHNHIFMNQHLSNGSLSDSGAEDLSLRSHGNSNDSFFKPESPHRDIPVFPMKHEPFSYQDNGHHHHNLQQENPKGLDLSPQSRDPSPTRSSYHSPKLSHTATPVSCHSPQPTKFVYTKEVSESVDSKMYRHSPENAFLSPGPFLEKTMEIMKGGVAEEEEEEEDMQMNGQDLRIQHQSEALNMIMESKVEGGKVEMDVVESDNLGEEFRHLQKEIGQLNGEEKEEPEFREPLSFVKQEDDSVRGDSLRDSPRAYRESPVEPVLTNQELYSPLLHANNMAVVSHSMT